MARQRTFSVGRSPECDVVLADPSVSRRHAEVEVQEAGGVRVRDRSSTHGTYLLTGDGPRRIAEEVLQPDDRLRFGEVTVTAAELVEAIRLRYPALDIGALPDPRGEAAGGSTRPSRFVRCVCGTVKPRGAVCPGCGHERT